MDGIQSVIASTFTDYSSEYQTYAEELLNTITHGILLLISIPAVILLVLLARLHGNTWHVVGCSLYGSTLVLMYLFSTVYHCSGITDLSHPVRLFLKDLDHCAIYFLIAGTYTPLTLVNLIYNNRQNTYHIIKHEFDRRIHNLGWVLLISIWCMCFIGVSLKMLNGSDNLHPVFSYGFYLLMGWLGAIVAKPFIKLLPRVGIRLLVAGGLSYTIGVVFLLSDFMPFNHPVWHLFVSAGSVLHYLSVIACTIPIAHSSSWKMMEKRTLPILHWVTRFVSINLTS